MQTSDNKPAGSRGTAGIKFLVSSFSLAGILGFWNMFANKSFSESIASFMTLLSANSQPPATLALDLPPMPALDPLPTVVAYQQVNFGEIAVGKQVEEGVAQQAPQAPQAGVSLRVVGAPTPAPIVQTVKPKVEQVQAASAVSSGGGGGGSSKKSSGGGSSKSSK